MGTMQARKQARPAEYDIADDDAMYDTRLPTSTRRYKPVTNQPTTRASQHKGGQRALQTVEPDEIDDGDVQTPKGIMLQRRRSGLNVQPDTTDDEDVQTQRSTAPQRRRSGLN